MSTFVNQIKQNAFQIKTVNDSDKQLLQMKKV